MSIFSSISSALRTFFEYVKHIVRKVIHGVLNFFRHVVGYFKDLHLRRERDTPFIMDSEQLKNMIHNAPVEDVGIFAGVYNEDTNTIEQGQMLQADQLDQKTQEILDKGQNGLVVLQ